MVHPMMMVPCIVIRKNERVFSSIFIVYFAPLLLMLLSTIDRLCFVILIYFYNWILWNFCIYLGIENLQGFCKQNQKFSTGLNPSEICVNRESVRSFNLRNFHLSSSSSSRFVFFNVFMKEVYIKWKKCIIKLNIFRNHNMNIHNVLLKVIRIKFVEI
jgi:hypothetical protein